MQYHLLFGHHWRISWNLLYDPTECAQLYHDHDWQPTTKPDKNFKKETKRLLQKSESIQSIKSIQVFFFPVKWKKNPHKHDSFNTKTLLKLCTCISSKGFLCWTSKCCFSKMGTVHRDQCQTNVGIIDNHGGASTTDLFKVWAEAISVSDFF